MKLKKSIIIGSFILLLLASIVFILSYEADQKRTFSEIVESGDLSNLRLTIYFAHNDFLSLPVSIDALKRGAFRDYKIVVKGNDLMEYMDSLQKLNKEPLIPFEQEANLDCRIYYVFTTKLGHKLYDVAMWGGDDKTLCIYVNGAFVKDSNIFYDVILPFLPQDAADELRTAVADIRQKQQ